jgi:hypothetical protein
MRKESAAAVWRMDGVFSGWEKRGGTNGGQNQKNWDAVGNWEWAQRNAGGWKWRRWRRIGPQKKDEEKMGKSSHPSRRHISERVAMD